MLVIGFMMMVKFYVVNRALSIEMAFLMSELQ